MILEVVSRKLKDGHTLEQTHLVLLQALNFLFCVTNAVVKIIQTDRGFIGCDVLL